MGLPADVLTMEPLPAEEQKPAPVAAPAPRIAFAWNRIGVIDLALAAAMTYAAVRYWSYLLTRR